MGVHVATGYYSTKQLGIFFINEYDYTNEIVQKSLAHCYTSEQNVINVFNCTFGRTEDETSEVNICSENLGHTNRGNKFICIHCRNSLRKKTPKMPDQACANGLDLDNIPQDLQDISPLERRIISLHIPFITLIVMRRYGGHYKMNGPP